MHLLKYLNLFFRDNVLNIQNVQKRNGGVYICVAENSLGESTYRRVYIKVKFAPIITVLHPNIVQAIEHDTYLDCFAEAYPLPSIIWMMNGIQLQSDDFLHKYLHKYDKFLIKFYIMCYLCLE